MTIERVESAPLRVAAVGAVGDLQRVEKSKAVQVHVVVVHAPPNARLEHE